jgi:large subunit ribosomal protein L32
VAVPKRKKSRARTRHRRAQWLRIAAPARANCSHCGSPMRPHTVCEVCGYYADRPVVTLEG